MCSKCFFSSTTSRKTTTTCCEHSPDLNRTTATVKPLRCQRCTFMNSKVTGNRLTKHFKRSAKPIPTTLIIASWQATGSCRTTVRKKPMNSIKACWKKNQTTLWPLLPCMTITWQLKTVCRQKASWNAFYWVIKATLRWSKAWLDSSFKPMNKVAVTA